MPRVRLDILLVRRGLAPSRERARALIMEGKVLVYGLVATKAGTMVHEDAEVCLGGRDIPYVSRGGLKLAHALDHFKLDVQGLVALDAGASTGGFTDVLLQRGARRVYAVDVGYGQLAWKLRNDPRVVCIERENIRTMPRERIPEALDIIVADLSFISLTLVLKKFGELLDMAPPVFQNSQRGTSGPPEAMADENKYHTPGCTEAIRKASRSVGRKILLVLIKPQFEVGREGVGKGGVVRDPALREQAARRVILCAREQGWIDEGIVESPILGPAGNVEYFALFRSPP